MTNEDVVDEIMRERASELLKEEIKIINKVELLKMKGIWENAR